jgi:hypothetical protein
MIPILQEIKSKLICNDYSNEDQVRFSIVTRILQKLGWDIWNPNECCFEYPVKKFPTKDLNKDECGRVDIALFLANDSSPEVFIETKKIGMLSGNYNSQQEQLSRYNYYETSAISILTDGVIWKFYLPSAGGTFNHKLFKEINLLEDDEHYIYNIFLKVLNKENFRKKAINASLEMLEEQKIIEGINKIKTEAELKSHDIDLNKFDIAQQILKNRYKKNYSVDLIEKLWDRKFNVNDNNSVKDNELTSKINLPPAKEINLNNFDPTGKKPKLVFIIDQWYEVKSWIDIYVKVCEILISKFPETDLSGYLQTSNIWPKLNVKKVNNGKFLLINWNSKECIKKSIKILSDLGFRNIRIKI